MMHNHGSSRTPPRISLNSSYSYGYSPTSEDPRSALPSAQHDALPAPRHYEISPVSPPLRLLTDEYSQAFQTPTGQRSDDEQKTAFDLSTADPMDLHLLLETAMNDSQQSAILSLDDLDALKKEESRLARLIEAGKKKLYLESKVDSTSRLIQKLNPSGSAATSPTSPMSSKKSFLRFRTSGSSSVDNQNVQGEAGGGSARFQELAKEVWRLEKRQAELHKRKLEHTAGVLQYNSFRQTHRQSGSSSGSQNRRSPSLQGLDGTLEGLEWQSAAQSRLPRINSELHNLLAEVETQYPPSQNSPPGIDLEPSVQFEYLEKSLEKLSDSHNYLRRLVSQSRGARENQEKEVKDSQEVLRQLWDIIGASEDGIHNGIRHMESIEDNKQLNSHESSYGQSFSSQALSSKVQKLCSRATLLSRHQSALTQQLSQEREARRNSNSARAAERAQVSSQLQDAYMQQLAHQGTVKELQSKLKAAGLRLKETQHLVDLTKQDCETKLADEIAQERNSWKAREHDLSAKLASKMTEAGLLRTAISDHEATIAELQAAEAATISEFNEADHQIETLGANLMAAENRLAKYESAEMDNSRVLNQLTADKERQEAELALLREEVAKITADLLAAEGHLTRYEASAEDSAEKLAMVDAAKQAADAEVQRLTINIATLTTRVHETERHGAEASSDAQNTRRQISELMSAKEILEFEMSHLRDEQLESRALLNNSNDQASKHQKSAQEWSQHASELDSHRQELEKEIKQSREEFVMMTSQLNGSLRTKEDELEKLSSKHMALLQDFKELNNAHNESEDALHQKTKQIQGLRLQLAEMTREIEALSAHTGNGTKELEEIQGHLEQTVANHKIVENRAIRVEIELKDLLREYEQLVKMEVEAEREREILEGNLETLRSRVEELQTQLDEERVRSMGHRNSGSTNGDHVNGYNGDTHAGDVRRSTDGISMGVMRNEFKRMMREARADHYRRLKAEQDEHRRLEEIIRSMQRDRFRSRSSVSLETPQSELDRI